MPSNQSPLGALPARFRRERLLIVGCGDVGSRIVRNLAASTSVPRMRLLALTSHPQRCIGFRAQGVVPLVGDLDNPATLQRLAGISTRVLHLAPPSSQDNGRNADPRTTALMRALRRRRLPTSLVYVSTSGVYGDCAGAVVPETRPAAPATPRAQRRMDAERAVRHFGHAGAQVSILRVPGIYASDREGGTPEARLRKGTPVLAQQDDVYTNHIHADDLARACIITLWRGRRQRTYNISDASALKMGDYFDLAAGIYGLPKPPRVPRDAAHEHLPAAILSFMSESRRLSTQRMQRELGLALRYPTVLHGLTPNYEGL